MDPAPAVDRATPQVRRPASVTALAIVNLVLFVLLSVSLALFTILLVLGFRATDGRDVDLGGVPLFGCISAVLGLEWIAAIGLLVSGVGLLQMRRWARKFAIGAAAYLLVAIAIEKFVNYGILAPAIQRYAEAHPTDMPPAPSPSVDGAVRVQDLILFGCAVATVVILRRRRVVDAFAARG